MVVQLRWSVFLFFFYQILNSPSCIVLQPMGNITGVYNHYFFTERPIRMKNFTLISTFPCMALIVWVWALGDTAWACYTYSGIVLGTPWPTYFSHSPLSITSQIWCWSRETSATRRAKHPSGPGLKNTAPSQPLYCVRYRHAGFPFHSSIRHKLIKFVPIFKAPY